MRSSEFISKAITEAEFDEAAGEKDAKKKTNESRFSDWGKK